MNVRDVILFFAIKYHGDWDKINQAIKSLERVPQETVEEEKKKLRCQFVTLIDEDYPNSLKNIYKPPFVLFYYGDLSLTKKSHLLGVVGSREASEYAKESTRYILKGIKELEPVIISGLALGIDGVAHQCALDNLLPTIAVLGTGIEECYPKENFSLYQKIKERGLLISEYPYKENVSRERFPNRNRIISGLSELIFVPEAHERSGTLITVRFALSQGKDVVCLPHPISSHSVTNILIQEGAKLINSPQDLKEELK